MRIAEGTTTAEAALSRKLKLSSWKKLRSRWAATQSVKTVQIVTAAIAA